MIGAGEAHIKSDKQICRRSIKPGTYRSASDGDAQSVDELTARLKKATGREAIRLGTALTKAKRALNGG